MSRTIMMMSVDTEEDNWVATREGLTTLNIRELPKLQRVMERLGVPLTYFTTHAVATTPSAAAIIRDLHQSGAAEVGAHLHPWNTPPLDDAFEPRNTMMKNLPPALQRSKLERLTAALTELRRSAPTSFRAGRFGIGPEGIAALRALDYLVDSSVTPWTSWATTDEGADFVGAPLEAYRLDGTGDVRHPTPAGLAEIPVSAGYTRWPFDAWHSVWSGLKPVRVAGVAARLGAVRPVMLSPETNSVDDMLKLAEVLVEHGVRHLSMFWHSPSLVPGLSPFTKTASEVDQLYGSIAEFVERLVTITTPAYLTVTEAAKQLLPDAEARPAQL